MGQTRTYFATENVDDEILLPPTKYIRIHEKKVYKKKSTHADQTVLFLPRQNPHSTDDDEKLEGSLYPR
jgi:hypothetical protein